MTTFMNSPKYLFTSESVTEGHPDKICDQIADAIVTDILQHDRNARVAIECLLKKSQLFIAGEVTALDSRARRLSLAGRPDIEYDLARNDIGSLPVVDSVAGAPPHARPDAQGEGRGGQGVDPPPDDPPGRQHGRRRHNGFPHGGVPPSDRECLRAL